MEPSDVATEPPLEASTPAISVVIPAFNEEELIAQVIRSVRQSFAKQCPAPSYEIVVCDNNSSDRTAEIAAAQGAIVCFESHNQIARARNTGARKARAPWLIFLDGDTYLNPELLRETMRNMRSGRIGAGGAALRFDTETLRFPWRLTLKVWNTASAAAGLAAGSYIYCLREAWIDTGGFNETFYAGEEIFFSRQLKQWARERGMRFDIITAAPITTSARKFTWFSRWDIARQFLSLGVPGRLRSRARCGLWYERPTIEPAPVKTMDCP